MSSFLSHTTHSLLCPLCQPLGYCSNQVAHSVTDAQQVQYYRYISDPLDTTHALQPHQIANLVPVRTAIPKTQTALHRSMQLAHDCFHQHDYEQAIYRYRSLLATHNNLDEAHWGLAASHYMLQQYELAATALAPLRYFSSSLQEEFYDACIAAAEMEARTAARRATATHTGVQAPPEACARLCR